MCLDCLIYAWERARASLVRLTPPQGRHSCTTVSGWASFPRRSQTSSHTTTLRCRARPIACTRCPTACVSDTGVSVSNTGVGVSYTRVGVSHTRVGVSNTRVGVSNTRVSVSNTDASVSHTTTLRLRARPMACTRCPTACRAGSNRLFRSLTCTGDRRNSATCGTNQGNWKR